MRPEYILSGIFPGIALIQIHNLARTTIIYLKIRNKGIRNLGRSQLEIDENECE